MGSSSIGGASDFESEGRGIVPHLPYQFFFHGRISQLAEDVDLRARATGAQISSILIAQQKSIQCGFESHCGYHVIGNCDP